MQIEGKDENVE